MELCHSEHHNYNITIRTGSHACIETETDRNLFNSFFMVNLASGMDHRHRSLKWTVLFLLLPLDFCYMFASHSFSHMVSKYFLSFNPVFFLIRRKVTSRGKILFEISSPFNNIIILIIIFTSSVSSLHQEHSTIKFSGV